MLKIYFFRCFKSTTTFPLYFNHKIELFDFSVVLLDKTYIMKNKIRKYPSIILITFITFSLFSFKGAKGFVNGWFLAGSDKMAYEIGITTNKERTGKVAFLKSIKPTINSKFGTIMQSFDAEIYLDKRVKLTGHIKTVDVKSWAGMWMRVDGKNKKVLEFDNMKNRKIIGTTEWTKYEIVLDVPEKSTSISYGVLLNETGTVYLDDLSFKEVNKDISKTKIQRLKKPTNSSFED